MRLRLILAGTVLLGGCGGERELASEARLAQALEAMQQSRLEEAARSLAAIKPSGGWLRPATWSAPLALRLRVQISFRLGAQEETVSLLNEYENRYGDLAPAAYMRDRLEFLERYSDWQGTPALLYLRAIEAEETAPAIALREWRVLLRDYPHSAIAPTARLRFGLLQKKLENSVWALDALHQVAEMPVEVVDPDGNAVAPQARIAVGQIHRDLMTHEAKEARAAFRDVVEKYGEVVMHGPGGEPAYSPAVMAETELARTPGVDKVEVFMRLADVPEPTGYVTPELVGDIRGEARLRLTEINLARRSWGKARERLVEMGLQIPDAEVGPPAGPRRWYGYVAIDWLEEKVGARSTKEALAGLEEIAAKARLREMWIYAQLSRLRILARLGRQKEAREILAEMEKRFPSLTCDPQGDGLLLVPSREARRVLGG